MIHLMHSNLQSFSKHALIIAAAVLVAAAILPSPSARAEGASCATDKKQTCEQLVQDNILWRISDPDSPASKHWAQENLDALCACTTDAYATVNCFQVQVNNNHKTWQDAIATCRAKH
jgi:hypothetical protein